MAEVLAKTRPLIDMLWDRETHAGPTATPEQRAALEDALKALAATRSPTRRSAATTTANCATVFTNLAARPPGKCARLTAKWAAIRGVIP